MMNLNPLMNMNMNHLPITNQASNYQMPMNMNPMQMNPLMNMMILSYMTSYPDLVSQQLQQLQQLNQLQHSNFNAIKSVKKEKVKSQDDEDESKGLDQKGNDKVK